MSASENLAGEGKERIAIMGTLTWGHNADLTFTIINEAAINAGKKENVRQLLVGQTPGIWQEEESGLPRDLNVLSTPAWVLLRFFGARPNLNRHAGLPQAADCERLGEKCTCAARDFLFKSAAFWPGSLWGYAVAVRTQQGARIG